MHAHRDRTRTAAIAILISLTLTAAALFTSVTAHADNQPRPAASPDAALAANPLGRYIVVLGARMGTFGNPPAVLTQRVNRAATLAKRHPLTRVIASGGNTWWLPISEASFMQSGLFKRGVPLWQVLGEHRSTSTVENARNVVGMLRNLHASGAVIVTNGSHMKRALKNFRDAADDQRTSLKFTPAYA